MEYRSIPFLRVIPEPRFSGCETAPHFCFYKTLASEPTGLLIVLNMIGLRESSRIIQLCCDTFDSHQFILFLIMTNPHLYFRLLERYHNDITLTDSQIGRFLERNQGLLDIRKIDVVSSLNINSKVTPCALWEKIY